MFCLQFERNIHQHLQTELKAEPAECMASQNFAKMSELLLIITETKTQTGLVLRIWKMSWEDFMVTKRIWARHFRFPG